mmetsp:Transcript_25861/g.71330  ORF Transcript_25861/g.71330 Transcript_25861/m.71330 type:complete len:465 (+) Transcript_25861:780-2174(+)
MSVCSCICSASITSHPPASSSSLACGLPLPGKGAPGGVPARRIASSAERTARSSCTSGKLSKLRKSAITPSSTSHRTTSADPEQHALHNAYATSLRTSYSSELTISRSRGTNPAAHTAATCAWSPAVRLETIHAVSLRSSFLALPRSSPRQPSTPKRSTTAASSAVPATMFPIERSAGVCTVGCSWPSSATSGPTAPASTTGAMRSGGSETYESAQHVSVSTSSSVRTCNSCTSTGSAGAMSSQRGGGLPRQRLERSQVALRCIVGGGPAVACAKDEPTTLPPAPGPVAVAAALAPALPPVPFGGTPAASAAAASRCASSTSASHCVMSGGTSPYDSTKSRQRGESPAMLPSAHIDCSRTAVSGCCISATNTGTAPLSITTRACSDVPDATLVIAHAASKTSVGSSKQWRNWTRRGTTPAAMTSAMGGLRSMESSLRSRMHASSCVALSFEWSSLTSSGSAWIV